MVKFLFGNVKGFVRRFHLEEMPLPGGDAAIHHPSRIALAYLSAAGLDWAEELPPVKALSTFDKELLSKQIRSNINTPRTSSMGRLFDAVSALVGIRQTASYEGQAAIELENCADPNEDSAYEFAIEGSIVLLGRLINQVTSDYLAAVPIPIISAKFHNAIVNISVICVKTIRQETSCNTVALTGGVWQNMTLLGKMTRRLDQEGFRTLIHHRVPTNDAGISIGQLVILAANLQYT